MANSPAILLKDGDYLHIVTANNRRPLAYVSCKLNGEWFQFLEAAISSSPSHPLKSGLLFYSLDYVYLVLQIVTASAQALFYLKEITVLFRTPTLY